MSFYQTLEYVIMKKGKESVKWFIRVGSPRNAFPIAKNGAGKNPAGGPRCLPAAAGQCRPRECKGGSFMSIRQPPHNHGQAIEQELERVPSVENFQTVADIFKQLGDGSRIRIFWLLCHCEECVTNLSAMVNMSSPAASHHLRQLKAGKLIVSRREGKEVYYKAAETEKAQLLHRMIEELVEIACPTRSAQRGEGQI